ncbi:kinase-like domain-containing protein [Mycena olivaceomarginata]|nr:kinase-like domain-containing protein [Mycena olivaceomarginata]
MTREAAAAPARGFDIETLPPAPAHYSPNTRRFTDLFYKTEHEAHVRVGDHPRVVRYYGWDNRGLLFEKHKGGDLLTHLLTHRDPPPSLAFRLQLASDIAEGIAFLHSKGVIWVDVSMTNVLLSEDSQHGVLCDLGGSSILPMPGYKPLPAAYKDAMVTLHPMMGLPHYPNSFVWDGPGHDNFAEISPHHDRFGYGLLLFCLVDPPFPPFPIATLHFSKEFDSLGDLPQYAAFERIIQKCFHAEYRSSDDLEAEVKAACIAMDKDAPLLHSQVQDPIIELPPSTGRILLPFDREEHWEEDCDVPDYEPF